MTQDRTPHLITEAQHGDRAAFDALIEENRSHLESWMRSRIGSFLRAHLSVDDALQETFSRAFQSITRFRWQGEPSFLRWLKTIANRVILEAVREQKKGPTLQLLREPIGRTSSPSKGIRQNERFDRLEESLKSLSANRKEIVVLALIDGLQVSEIAERLGRSQESVRKLLSRALKELKDSFGETRSFSLPDRAFETEQGGSHVDE